MKFELSLAVLLALILPVLRACGQSAGASQPFAEFAASEPVRSADRGAEEFEKIFPAFQRVPFDQSGCNPVVAPFQYTDPHGLGNANEGMAFSLLLSYDLYWSPGYFGMRPAYAPFKQDPRYIETLSLSPGSPMLKRALSDLKATHFIRGELVRSSDGYSGKLEIRQIDGTMLLFRPYDRPRPYFDLLGDMSVDMLTYFYKKPTDALAAFLHQPRCSHFESLSVLGAAAYLSGPFGFNSQPADKPVYEEILRGDPSFALARLWAATEYNDFPNPKRYQPRVVECLKSRVDIASLYAFEPSQWTDAAQLAQYRVWQKQAADMLDEDHPFKLIYQLQNKDYGTATRQEILDRALRVARRLPNCDPLLNELANQFCQPPADEDMAASLCLVPLENRYPFGGESDFGRLALDLGQTAIAEHESPGYRGLEAMCTAGRFNETQQAYWDAGPRYDPAESVEMAPFAAFAAAAANKPSLLKGTIEDQHDALVAGGLLEVFEGYQDLLAGKRRDTSRFATVKYPLSAEARWPILLLAAQDSVDGTSRFRRLMGDFGDTWPNDRLAWIALDHYERRDPTPDGASFYDYLDWLHGNDPWVVSAVTDYRKRSGGAAPVIDFTTVRADLINAIARVPYRLDQRGLDWAHEPSSWRVASGIHQLIQNGRLDDAAELAALNNRLQIANGGVGQQSLSFLLLRKANERP